MADPFLLVDGYNLMHAVGMFRRRYGPGEFAKWRDRFLHYLSQHLTPRERERTTVVFDAPSSGPGPTQSAESHGLQVLYARSDLEADDVLEELIAGHSAPRQILLVSSDHRLQKAVRRRRGKAIDSEDFALRLEERENQGSQRKPPSLPRCKFTGLHSPGELEAWLEIFGDIPEAARLKRPAPESDVERLQREIDELSR
jgi:uncharacterized protein